MRKRFHPDANLPGCMMPDGGECCAGYQALVDDWRRAVAILKQIDEASFVEGTMHPAIIAAKEFVRGGK